MARDANIVLIVCAKCFVIISKFNLQIIFHCKSMYTYLLKGTRNINLKQSL